MRRKKKIYHSLGKEWNIVGRIMDINGILLYRLVKICIVVGLINRISFQNIKIEAFISFVYVVLLSVTLLVIAEGVANNFFLAYSRKKYFGGLIKDWSKYGFAKEKAKCDKGWSRVKVTSRNSELKEEKKCDFSNVNYMPLSSYYVNHGFNEQKKETTVNILDGINSYVREMEEKKKKIKLYEGVWGQYGSLKYTIIDNKIHEGSMGKYGRVEYTIIEDKIYKGDLGKYGSLKYTIIDNKIHEGGMGKYGRVKYTIVGDKIYEGDLGKYGSLKYTIVIED